MLASRARPAPGARLPSRRRCPNDPLAGRSRACASSTVDGPRRPLLHDAARRPRRRRRQGRAARGRRDARLGPAVGRSTRPTARAPPRTSCRSTATSAASGSTCSSRPGPTSFAGCSADGDVLVENFRPGGSRPARLRRRGAARAQPAPGPPGDHRLRPDGPAADRPGYDFVIQAVERPDVDHRRGRRGGRRPDQGRRRDQRRRDRDARRGRRPGGARRPRERDGDRAAGGGQRIDVSLLGSTLAILVNQAQNAFVDGARPAGSATPTRTSSRTRRSPRPTARSRSRSARSGSGRGSARRSGCPALADDPRFATNGERVENRAELRPILAERFRDRHDRRLAGRPRGGRGPGRADQRRPRPRSPRPRRARAG